MVISARPACFSLPLSFAEAITSLKFGFDNKRNKKCRIFGCSTWKRMFQHIKFYQPLNSCCYAAWACSAFFLLFVPLSNQISCYVIKQSFYYSESNSNFTWVMNKTFMNSHFERIILFSGLRCHCSYKIRKKIICSYMTDIDFITFTHCDFWFFLWFLLAWIGIIRALLVELWFSCFPVVDKQNLKVTICKTYKFSENYKVQIS